MSQEAVKVSVSPDGEAFPLPETKDYQAELGRLERLVAEQRALGREIVVVMGVGFVGAVMAEVVADSTGPGRPAGQVRHRHAAPQPPQLLEDSLPEPGPGPGQGRGPRVDVLIARCVKEKKTLTASFSYEALTMADVVVVDVQCDYSKAALADVRQGTVEMHALEESLKVIGEKISASCLVLIETTVPPGTTEFVAYPIMRKAFRSRGLEGEPLLATPSSG